MKWHSYPEAVGSNPAPATTIINVENVGVITVSAFFVLFKKQYSKNQKCNLREFNVDNHLNRSMSHKLLYNSNIDTIPYKIGTVLMPEAIGNQIRS